MKKIFGFVGMWLLAMTLCFSFMACSSDDGEEERSEGVNGGPGVNGGGKRLVSITWTMPYPEGFPEKYHIIVRRFEYDKFGRIVKEIEDDDRSITTYEYGETKIIATTRTRSDWHRGEYSLKNGRIVKLTIDYGSSVDNVEYKYDGNKLLTNANPAHYNSIITWDGDNIATWGDCAYIYSNIEFTIGWLDCYSRYNEEEVLFNQGYFGARPRNLVTTKTFNTAVPSVESYKYEVNDGYVTKKVRDDGATTEYVWE